MSLYPGHRSHLALGGVALLIAALIGYYFSGGGKLAQGLPANHPVTQKSTPAKLGPFLTSSELRSVRQRLANAKSHENWQDLQLELQQLLWRCPPAEVGQHIREFLASGEDAETGAPFDLGDEGLASAPTLRVYLLDMLERLDLAEAATEAAHIVNQMNSPDEVAIAMRTLMRLPASDERHALVFSAIDTVLGRKDWLAKPSLGYLEAFDLVAASDQPSNWRQLLSLSIESPGSSPFTTKAAYLAAQTLAQRSGDFRRLVADPTTSPRVEPRLRGQLIAWLDPRQPAELALLESFIRSPTLSAAEAKGFGAAFPAQRDLVGRRLFSEPLDHVRSLADAAALDLAADAALQRWTQLPLNAAMKPVVAELAKRLALQAKAAHDNGY